MHMIVSIVFLLENTAFHSVIESIIDGWLCFHAGTECNKICSSTIQQIKYNKVSFTEAIVDLFRWMVMDEAGLISSFQPVITEVL